MIQKIVVSFSAVFRAFLAKKEFPKYFGHVTQERVLFQDADVS